MKIFKSISKWWSEFRFRNSNSLGYQVQIPYEDISRFVYQPKRSQFDPSQFILNDKIYIWLTAHGSFRVVIDDIPNSNKRYCCFWFLHASDAVEFKLAHL